MTEACTAFGTPITGGNVSLYNETFGEDIYPTPVAGIVGVAADVRHVTTAWYRNPGDTIVLIQPNTMHVGRVAIEDEMALQRVVLDAIRAGLVKSAHDTSEGGLAVAIAECCYSNIHRPPIGATVQVPSRLETMKDLFGEYSSRIIVSTSHAAEIVQRAEAAGLRGVMLGAVGGDRLVLEYEGQRAVDVAVKDLEAVWASGLSKLLS
jgi:phosphoribosylformylglycinamidine synthase